MKRPLQFVTKLFINNQFVNSSKGKKIPVVNPATEEVICEIEEAFEEDVELAI